MLVENPPAMQENWVQSLAWEDPLEKGTATHSSILAYRIPWTRYSPQGCKESDTTERLHFVIRLIITVSSLVGRGEPHFSHCYFCWIFYHCLLVMLCA